MHPQPGQNLGHYRLERLIGQGGMGAVFLAFDTRLQRPIALKVLPEEWARDADRLQRFEREARAVAALNHPHIVTIHSVEEADGVHFITMEMVVGTPLDRALASGALPLHQVIDVGIALADALAAAHEKGVVHRDIKPANVIVTKDAGVKVLDFGLAKLAPAVPPAAPRDAAEEIASAPTATGEPDDLVTAPATVLGTLPYMSPEQIGGDRVDGRADIFSLGVVLYEMATGRRPFVGKNQAETISAILRDAPRPISASRPEAPRQLARIVDHCLRKLPRDRFQTARDVCNELQALRREIATEPGSSLGTQAEAPGPEVRARRAPPWVWALVAAAAGALVVGIVVPRFRTGGGPGGPRGWTKARVEPGASAGPGAAGAGIPAGAPTARAAMVETASLVVLPFENLSGDKDQEYFSDGMTEELLNNLTRIPELRVIGRTSSFAFKGKNEDLRVIGERLGVAHILEGSVRRSGRKVRITARLLKASDGFNLWSETYDRTFDDIFAVQEDIAGSVAQALRVRLVAQHVDERRPDAEAYDLVLRAHAVWQPRTEEAIGKARDLLKQALELSPDYAPAWAEMGVVHVREQERAATVEGRQQAAGKARDALGRALEKDPGLAVAWSRMAGLQRDAWDFAGAGRSTEKALAAGPKNTIVLANAATIYGALGRTQEAILLEEQAEKADPLNVITLINLAIHYRTTGRLDDAEATCRKVIELRPDIGDPYENLAHLHLLRGQADAARASFAKSDELAGWGEWYRPYYEALVAHTAHDSTAAAAAADFEKRFGAGSPLSCADVRAWRGEADAAFAWLEKALAARDPFMARLKEDVYLTGLHPDPRWNALLAKVGLPVD